MTRKTQSHHQWKYWAMSRAKVTSASVFHFTLGASNGWHKYRQGTKRIYFLYKPTENDWYIWHTIILYPHIYVYLSMLQKGCKGCTQTWNSWLAAPSSLLHSSPHLSFKGLLLLPPLGQHFTFFMIPKGSRLPSMCMSRVLMNNIHEYPQSLLQNQLFVLDIALHKPGVVWNT